MGRQFPWSSSSLLGGPYVDGSEAQDRRRGASDRDSRLRRSASLLAVAFGAVGPRSSSFGTVDMDSAPDGIQAIEFVAFMVAVFNVFLGLVNLVPGYPLDGARVLHALVWQRTGPGSGLATAAAIRISRYVGDGPDRCSGPC
jgi:membrane-associated protease RseP (regulator of RpoE activity)